MEDGTPLSGGHTDVPIADPRGGGRSGAPVAVTSSDACEIRDLLDRLSDKWSLLVLELLGAGTRRFSELHREIRDISQRMLTLTLRNLERDGLVSRTVHPVVPPRVDYELTDIGRSLLATVEPLVSWARAHGGEVAGARAAFDARAAAAPAHAVSPPRR